MSLCRAVLNPCGVSQRLLYRILYYTTINPEAGLEGSWRYDAGDGAVHVAQGLRHVLVLPELRAGRHVGNRFPFKP